MAEYSHSTAKADGQTLHTCPICCQYSIPLREEKDGTLVVEECYFVDDHRQINADKRIGYVSKQLRKLRK